MRDLDNDFIMSIICVLRKAHLKVRSLEFDHGPVICQLGGSQSTTSAYGAQDLLGAAKDAGLETLVLDHPTEELYQWRWQCFACLATADS